MASSGNEKIPPVVEALSGSVGCVHVFTCCWCTALTDSLPCPRASIANVIVYPLDLVAARIQTKAPLRRSKHQDPKTSAHHKQDDYADTLTALRTIYRTNNHSLSGFYQGIASDTLSTALSQFLYFYIFAALMRLFNKHVDKAIADTNKKNIGTVANAAGKAAVKISAAKELLIGSIAGILSRGVTTPLSTITVRKQTAAKQKAKPEENSVQNGSSGDGDNDNEDDDDEDEDYAPDSSIDIAKDIYQEHGLPGFWRGYGSACALVSDTTVTKVEAKTSRE